MAGCATQQPAPPVKEAPTHISVTGTLTFEPALKPPPETVIVVELSDLQAASNTQVAQQRTPIAERSAPLQFDLKVPNGRLTAGIAYVLRTAALLQGKPTWVSEEMLITAQPGNIVAGEVRMLQALTDEIATTMRCGTQTGRVSASGGGMQISIAGESINMRQVGATRFENAADKTSNFTGRGADRGTLVLKGKRLPECILSRLEEHRFAATLAGGPQVKVERGLLSFAPGDGAAAVEAPVALLTTQNRLTGYLADDGKALINVTLADKACQPVSNALPLPQTVRVEYNGKRYEGCAGSAADMLRGNDWSVTSIDDNKPADGTKLTLDFGTGGVLSGKGGCNTFRGNYVLTAEQLTLSKIALTRKACPAPLMQQERNFTQRLAEVERFEVSDDGSVVLITKSGRKISVKRGG
jgi:putative lipoprotein